MSSRTKTLLPTASVLLTREVVDVKHMKRDIRRRQTKHGLFFNRGVEDKIVLDEGDTFQAWLKGRVILLSSNVLMNDRSSSTHRPVF